MSLDKEYQAVSENSVDDVQSDYEQDNSPEQAALATSDDAATSNEAIAADAYTADNADAVSAADNADVATADNSDDASSLQHSLLESLNEQQLEIVTAVPQDMMVIAGAGTGKTHVMISRIATLLSLEQARPWNILAMTFTNKAAAEMSDRVCKYMHWQDPHHMILSTFHSFCLRMLKQYALQAMLPQNFVLLDPNDQANLLLSFLRDHGIEATTRRSDGKINVYDVINYISQQKDAGIAPRLSEEQTEDYIAHLSPVRDKELLSHNHEQELHEVLYACYRLLCARTGAVDFDDLIGKMVLLLKNNEQVRTSLQRRFRFIFVDEFQDTNRMQYELLMQLKGKDNYICVVGDDDQCIYEWRGAKVGNIERLLQDLPEINTYSLTINYRSTQRILNFSNALIQFNEQRLLQKVLVTPAMFEAIKRCELFLLQNFFALAHSYLAPGSFEDETRAESKEDAAPSSSASSSSATASASSFSFALSNLAHWKCAPGQELAFKAALQSDVKLQPYLQQQDLDLTLLGVREREDLSLHVLNYYEAFIPKDVAQILRHIQWEEILPDKEQKLQYACLFAKQKDRSGIWPETLRHELFAEYQNWPKVQVLKGFNDGNLVHTIVSFLQHHNVPLNEIAVLYRNNSLSSQVDKILTFAGIAHQVYGGLRFYDRREIQAILAYLRLIVNATDDTAFQRIINMPRRGIGESSLKKLSEVASSVGVSLYEAIALVNQTEDRAIKRSFKKFLDFYQEIEEYKSLLMQMSLSDFVREVLVSSGLLAFFTALDKKGANDNTSSSRVDNLQQLLHEIEEFEKSSIHDVMGESDPFDGLNFNDQEAVKEAEDAYIKREASAPMYVEDMPPVERLRYFVDTSMLQAGTELTSQGGTKGKGVQLMTIHAAKGLEFTAVIVIGCESGIMPSYLSTNIEEERRLAYVAFTRAKRFLFACHLNQRMFFNGLKPCRPSDFLGEIEDYYRKKLNFNSAYEYPFENRVAY